MEGWDKDQRKGRVLTIESSKQTKEAKVQEMIVDDMMHARGRRDEDSIGKEGQG